MTVTMRDVARKAEVSIKTVSRVVNEQGEISEDTRQRVLQVIKELGYRPNLIARGLVTQRTSTIGLVVPDITNPFFAEVARGVQDAARVHNYNTFLCNTDENQQEELRTLYSLAAQGVDGIIAFPSFFTGNNLDVFAEQYRPIVSVNHICQHPNVGVILTENHLGAMMAVDHLVSKGHTQIGMLAGLEVSPVRGRRVQGFIDAMTRHGLLPLPIFPTTPIVEGGYEAALKLLTQHPQLTAIFTYNDLLAFGAMKACKTLGRKIPDDCAIIGFDDVQLASLVNPALTTVHLDKYRIGQQAMDLLFKMLNNPDEKYPAITMETTLAIRESA